MDAVTTLSSEDGANLLDATDTLRSQGFWKRFAISDVGITSLRKRLSQLPLVSALTYLPMPGLLVWSTPGVL